MTRKRQRCDDCQRPFGVRLPLGPILFDSVWSGLVSEPSAMLCDECMNERALKHLGRSLHLDDLIICPHNFYEGRFETYLLEALEAEPDNPAYAYLADKLDQFEAEWGQWHGDEPGERGRVKLWSGRGR
jgi:hypothetical protein